MVDCIDFERQDFSKVISLNPAKLQHNSPFVNCKYELVRLEEIVTEIQTAKRPEGGVGKYSNGILSLGGEHIDNTSGYIKLDSPKYVPVKFYENFKIKNKGIIKENDILICKDGALTGKIALVRNEFKDQAAMINEHIFLIRCNNAIKQKYLFYILHSDEGQSLLKSKITGSAQGGLNKDNLKNIQIPLPPLEIQKQIVNECEKIEEQYHTIRMSVEEYHRLIKAVLVKCGICEESSLINGGGGLEFSSLNSIDEFIYSLLEHIEALESKLDFSLIASYNEESQNFKSDFKRLSALLASLPTPPQNGWEKVRLNNRKYFSLNPSKKELADIDENTIVSFVEMASVSDSGFIQNKIDKSLKELKKGGYTYFRENDILIAKITPCMENGKCAIAKNLTNNLGLGSTEFHIFRVIQDLKPKILFLYLNRDFVRQEAAKNMIGTSGHKRVPISFYESLQIPLPPLEIQEQILSIIEKIEENIALISQNMDSLNVTKTKVLKRLLET